MALKKLKEKIYKVFLFGMQKEIRYRGFDTKMQELLLECQPIDKIESGQELTYEQKINIIDSICQIVSMCVIDEIDVKKLSYNDLIHIFFMMRKVSVSECIDLRYQLTHEDVEEKDRFEIISYQLNIDDIDFDITKNTDLKIDIDNDEDMEYTYIMQLPTVEYMIDNEKEIKQNQIATRLYGLIAGVITDGEYQTKDDFTLEEWIEAYNTFGSFNQNKFVNFIKNIPEVEHVIELQSNKFPEMEKKQVHIKGLESFF